jgi:hypothetical protein
MVTYAVRYIHKIAPSVKDTRPDIELPNWAGENRRTMARALRELGLLCKGERLSSFRVEPDSRIVCFPMASIWHSIILTPR